jgi:two-component SAPR family response regulator
MTNKELQDELKRYPDDVNVFIDNIEISEIGGVEYNNDSIDINDKTQKYILITAYF